MEDIRYDNTAIVFVDCQNDFVDGALGTEEAKRALPNVVRLAKLPIQYRYRTMDTHGNDYLDTLEGKKLPVPHTITDTEGWDHPDELKALLDRNCLMTLKTTFGGMGLAYAMLDLPKEVTQVIVCGFCTDICVIANALLVQAATYGRKTVVIARDACAGVTPELHEAALKVLQSCQADVITTDEIVARLA